MFKYYMKVGIKMKRKTIALILILILTLTFTLTGCKKKDVVEDPAPLPVDNPVEEVGEDEKEEIMNEFMDMVKDESNLTEIVNFIDKNIGKLTQLEGDRMLDYLERMLDENIEVYTESIISLDQNGELMEIAGTEFFYPESKISEIKNKELKEEVIEIYNNKYKLINLEGAFYPIIDYSKLKAYDNISEEWQDYLNVMAMDSEKVPFVDGALTISFDELAERIIKTENYLNKYVDGQRQEEMLLNYRNKLTAYLKGVPNTSIADRTTKVILDDVLESYEKTSNIADHVTSLTVQKYLEAIRANKNVIGSKVLERADALIEEAVETLSEYK